MFVEKSPDSYTNIMFAHNNKNKYNGLNKYFSFIYLFENFLRTFFNYITNQHLISLEIESSVMINRFYIFAMTE